MTNLTPKYLKDYKEPNYFVTTVEITFEINDVKQEVYTKSVAKYIKNINTLDKTLNLDGSAHLVSILLDNQLLESNQFILKDDKLTLINLPDNFTLIVNTKLLPWQDKSCMGLYSSRNNLFTQCESEGFRKITYYQDRPDVMATFTTHIIANKNRFTTLLSNGNKTKDIIENDLRIVSWHDPFKKPSYLFALVVANLESISDTFTTKSKRNVLLEIYAAKQNLNDLQHAMQSVKRSMAWDEARFNLEYDLDRYMIVASSDFNMGAMENKGLNIFNTKYVLANKDAATDTDFISIEAVIGHEYFHNWTGNRVTCRDWFQLSLKEGLTVFRDQEFTADMHSRSVKRISDVKVLRRLQFSEDAGPLAHSVRPESYLEMSNFYTVTIYEKGAEVVRMYQTIIGKDGFNKGLALYINRHDGCAVTCNDFCNAMSDANNIDLSQFMLWYSQAGTPLVKVKDSYNPKVHEYTLEFTQSIPDTPLQKNKLPQLIPIKIGLLDNNGHDLLNFKITSGRYIKHDDGLVLLLDNTNNKFTFANVVTTPTPSLLREFSAPIKLEYNYSKEQQILIISHDSDEFNRFEHLQHIFTQQIKSVYNLILHKEQPILDKSLNKVLHNILNNPNLSPDFRALSFSLPSFAELLTEIDNTNPNILANAISFVQQQIGELLFDSWMEIYNLYLTINYTFEDHAKRALKNIALFYIIKALNNKLNNPNSLQLIETMTLGQLHNADNMTDYIAVLTAINDTDIDLRNIIIDEFYQKWQDNELVMDKWFAICASSNLITIEQLNKLIVDKAFIATNPNKIYALLRTFTMNGSKFNSDAGYSFIADQVIAIDKFNPQVASTIVSGFSQTHSMHESYKKMAKSALQRILGQKNLSNDVYERADKIAINL